MIIDGRAPQARLEPIDPTWCAWEGVHGGYAIALAAAAARGADDGLPKAIHGTFVAPVPAQHALDVSLTELRRGRSGADVRVEVFAGNRRALDGLASFDRRRTGPDFERFPAPRVPRPDACDELVLLPVRFVPFTSHIQVRPTNEARPLAGGANPELVAWIRLQGAELEPWQVITVLLDALPPAMYAIATTAAVIPTTMLSVALTDHAHDCDPDDWCLVRIRGDSAASGWVVETSSVWNRRGVLLGCASQQRKILTPLHVPTLPDRPTA